MEQKDKITSEVIKIKNGYVWIDTCQLNDPIGNMMDKTGFGNPDATPGEFETMVFECDKDGSVISFSSLDTANYPTEEEAKIGHKKIAKKWKLK
jgi:hypothetical protein